MSGPSTRHGGHNPAQKFSTTGLRSHNCERAICRVPSAFSPWYSVTRTSGASGSADVGEAVETAPEDVAAGGRPDRGAFAARRIPTIPMAAAAEIMTTTQMPARRDDLRAPLPARARSIYPTPTASERRADRRYSLHLAKERGRRSRNQTP